MFPVVHENPIEGELMASASASASASLNLNCFNVTEDWLSGVRARLDESRAGIRDFRLANVGDSIATGMWGIDTTSDHYIARAADAVAGALGVASRRGLITCGTDDTTVRVEGSDWISDSSSAGFFGSRAYRLRAGGNAVLSYASGRPGCIIEVCYGGDGGLRYSVNAGRTWLDVAADARTGPANRCVRLEAPSASGEILIRARAAGPPASIHFLCAVDPESPAVSWFTSGVGSARTGDLYAALSAHDRLGFATYRAAAFDLLTIEIGVNNTIHADEESIAESAAALRSTLDGFVSAGVSAIALVGANPVHPDFQPGPWFVADAYREIYRPISQEYGIPLLELAARWGTWDTAHAQGYIEDQVHPTTAGHRDAGAMLANLVLSVL